MITKLIQKVYNLKGALKGNFYLESNKWSRVHYAPDRLSGSFIFTKVYSADMHPRVKGITMCVRLKKIKYRKRLSIYRKYRHMFVHKAINIE